MDGTWTTLVDWTHSSSIMPGTAPNHLRVDRIGSDIIIYINGTQVVTYDDSSFTGPGRDAGVRVYSSDDYPAYGRFDNFGVYRIPWSCLIWIDSSELNSGPLICCLLQTRAVWISMVGEHRKSFHMLCYRRIFLGISSLVVWSPP